MKIKNVIYILFSMGLLLSCDSKKNLGNSVTLKKADSDMSFALDDYTKTFIKALFLYEDKDGKEYLTFQNPDQNHILFYNTENCQLEFKVIPEAAGGDGVGFFFGYHIHNLDSIFLTSGDVEEISMINKNAEVITKIQYDKTADNLPLARAGSISLLYKPIVIIDNKMYIVSGCSRWSKKNCVSAVIDLNNRSLSSLPFLYPTFKGADNKAKRAGVENEMSRCWDGNKFVYSFYYDEDVYVASLDHKEISRVKIKSKYIDRVKLLDDYGNLTLTDICENPNYGNLLYDKYRNVYYRIAFPATEVEKNVNALDLLQHGRKVFSIIILDKDLQVIGETLFPANTYNSALMFIRKDGLYISDTHFLNPGYSDDVLSFKRFDLVGNE